MPSPGKTTICVYGDSHIACIKRAVDEKLAQRPGTEIEFWGASGPLFRGIHMQGGRLQPVSDEACEQVALVSGTGRESLGPEDFDVFFFVGSRLRAHSYITPMLWRQTYKAGFLSEAVRAMVLERWLTGCRAYRAARDFAASGARVFFSPASLLNDQILEEKVIAKSIHQTATAAQRAALWDGIAQRMQDDGVTLIAQPEETITRGCLTKLDYAADRAVELSDTVHKNGAYGALLLKDLYSHLDRAADEQNMASRAAG